jgi:hypothetical protein
MIEIKLASHPLTSINGICVEHTPVFHALVRERVKLGHEHEQALSPTLSDLPMILEHQNLHV